ncbi:GNAT family N-acetyltransferase [Buttiauxella izardii]|uniref:GNAT family N-acetyltransferase n=1 Tax=Buttiauxella izardii TaxID=82991 RepID=A0A3A5JWF8_9ENTR|nr:GNAT family N-acetyltransferase [Buttiauxella izardii]RJT21476.1 GNAT family N-acetyltransferase [Buttiauxella izardii]
MECFNLLIRSFTENDRLNLQTLYLQVRLSAWPWLDSSAWKPEDFDSTTQDEQIWVAEENGELLGFASVFVADNFLHSLYVAQKHQGKRVGLELLKKVQAEFTASGTLKCLVKNENALEFYLRHDWKIESTGDSVDGEYYLMRYAG